MNVSIPHKLNQYFQRNINKNLLQHTVSCGWKPMWILPIIGSTPGTVIPPDTRPTLHKGDVGDLMPGADADRTPDG